MTLMYEYTGSYALVAVSVAVAAAGPVCFSTSSAHTDHSDPLLLGGRYKES